MQRGPAPIAETTRWLHHGGELVESRHAGHIVVVGPRDEVVSLGDPHRITFPRSAVKPFQAAASLELIGEDLSPRLVAVGWASHRAEPAQLAAVRDMLAFAGLDPADLTTPPADGDAAAGVPDPLRHNCSGKHALFALAGRAAGCPRDRLLDPDGPVQRHVLAVVREAVGPPVGVGVDGCGAPAVAVPLAGLARAFRQLADPDGRWTTVVAAGLAHPLLMGGTGRLESALLAAGVVAKPGAEGVFGAAWRDRSGQRYGVAVKAEDGARRASAVALHGLLAALKVVPDGVWTPPPVLGGGRPAGSVRSTHQVSAFADRLGAVRRPW
ncbi:MAG: asparaginase [Actinobacteria bacterium]|nr:asparaginase [Actinomycetota bacterium]